MTDAPEIAPHVIATAGHVDHGKSRLIMRLTGIDPDRWDEEKRRGLTIDLGYAWCRLPSGREVGFVDVPGHERFVRNMLAGVGPVRLILFVVAADEGWRPQSEEHLAIVDVLGVEGAVVALTKTDLVDEGRLAEARTEVAERLRGTVLEGSRIVPCSAESGEGLGELVAAIDDMVGAAPEPERDGRARLFVDRVFTIKGAGTVVTGTLTGGPISLGDEVELYPTARRARVRGLQTHKRPVRAAMPVSRVAVNPVGAERETIARGDVLGPPGAWRPTRRLEARIRPVRGLAHPVTARGAFKLHAGSAERDARLRLYGASELGPEGAFVRISLSEPLVLAPFDRFVLREVGRRETVAGGVVLDPDPPARPGRDAAERLAAREAASEDELPALLLAERGAAREADVLALTGRRPAPSVAAVRAGGWWISADLLAGLEGASTGFLRRFHDEHPLEPGADLAEIRRVLAQALRGTVRAVEPDLVDAALQVLLERDALAREGSAVRLPSHRPALTEHAEALERLVRALAEGEPTPPTIPELLAAGHPRELLEAAIRAGMLVRVSAEIVLTPALVQRALAEIRASGASGLTVSALRERLGTTRKYAVPLVEHLDARGLTRRVGDARVAREP